MEKPKRASRCCFTGHRPEKLGVSEKEAKLLLREAIENAILDGFTTFISGMARGIDMWAAEIVLDEREVNDNIKLICASPYKGFEKGWSIGERSLYRQIMSSADYVKYVCEGYSRGCFQIRNCYMVDHSARVIAAYNGVSGGTRNTINYANKENIQVINIL